MIARLRRQWILGLLLLSAGFCLGMGSAETPAQPDARTPQTGLPDAGLLAQGNTAFALQLFQQLAQQPGNLFFSPFSISAAFGMAYAGANGPTATEMSEVMHFDLPAGRLHPAFRQLNQQLFQTGAEAGVACNIANGLWAQKDFAILPTYLSRLQTEYGVTPRTADFKHAAEQARQEINAWVENQTKEKIKDLVQPGVLQPLTKLVLVNAVYFKGRWTRAFDAGQTRPAPFASGPKEITVPMMHQTADFAYAESEGLQILELDYGQGGFSLQIFLPPAEDSLDTWCRKLTPELLGQWQQSLKKQKVSVFIPKMKLTQQFDLTRTLESLGMEKAFQPGADFSNLTALPGLFISDVLHKAFIEVNEEGTEAAAATALVMRATALRPEKPIPVFRADHPFVFLIQEKTTGSIMFLGRLVEPEEK